MSTLERVLLHAHTVDVGVDDKRRTFPLPREGLQPCVAPYFATRGRGDMRGGRGGVPPKSPPRRWWQAVAATMVLRATCCVSRGWLIVSCGAMTACHRLRGGIMGALIGGPRMSPTPRSAKYGATHGCHPLRGLIIPRLSESATEQHRLEVRQERGTRRWSGGYPHTYACRRYASVALGYACSAGAFVARGVPLGRLGASL